ncbi:MAG: MFS transporter [Janthinobacterium lividum]
MEALSGLLLGMFVAILSSTVVSNALPVIVPDLGGSESGYTWVVTASLLATTISTPIWGKLSDLFDKLRLVQSALVLFVVASAIAGLSQNMTMLIAMRVVQGLGAGGLTALAQVIMATMISPRERGRYSGYLGATFALATVGGPLVGGVLTEHLSWHWCFYVGVPFAVLAFVVLQKTLRLPTVKREVHIDYAGAMLLAAGVSALLVWVSLAGTSFAWGSWQTAALVGGGVALLALTVLAESRAVDPILPLRFFRNRTIVLSSLASLFVGIAMFGATVFLAQYFQLARGESPTMSGLLTLPMILGLAISSTVAGRFITRTGRWKIWVVSGGVLLTAGLGLMGTVEWDSPYVLVAVFMFSVGAGVGMMMQNLVLAVQNEVATADLGAASSFVAFTRTLGGAIGVSALGALLGHRVLAHLSDGLHHAGIDASAMSGGGGVPDLAKLPAPVRVIVQSAYGAGVSDVFLAAAPFALLALIIALFFRETTLRGTATPEPLVAPAVESAPEAIGGVVFTGSVRAGELGIPAALVVVTDATGEVVASQRTDDDGQFSLDLAAGGHVVTAHAEGWEPAIEEIHLENGTPARLDLVLLVAAPEPADEPSDGEPTLV